jgi:hypothetical protein
MTKNVVDGNAAAGLLEEIFAPEITSALVECEACGHIAPVASLRIYALAMAAVLRCPHCDGLLMRAVHTAHGRWLEMRGARYLRFRSST